MKTRIAALLLASLLPAVSFAWVETGSFYLGATTGFQLGDICDSMNFPVEGDCSGTAGNPDWRVEAEEAISRWHGVTSNFQFVTDPDPSGATSDDCGSAGPNSVFFLDDICGLGGFGGSTLAVALTFSFFDGVAIRSDVIFNTAFAWEAYDDALSNHENVIDFRRVAVHEFGHVAGLDHPFHELAIMSPFIQELINSPQPDDIAGMNAINGASLAFAIPDQNGNSTDELVHVWRASNGLTLASIRDSATGATIKDLTYLNSDYQTVDAVLIPDEDGSGAPELAVLALRLSDLRTVVQVRNISGPENPRTVSFSLDLTPMGLKYIGDADGNGVSELAVLAVREFDLRAIVEIRNAFGPHEKRTITFETDASPIDFDVTLDPAEVDPPRLTVLMNKWPDAVTDPRGFVDSRNAFGAQNRARAWLRPAMTPVSLIAIDEGGPNVAILAKRNIDDRTLVEVKNVIDNTGSFRLWSPAYSAINISAAGDADGNGQADIIVLTRRRTDGRVMAEVRNVDGSNLRVLGFTSTYDAVGSVFPLNDTDGDTFPELGVLTSLQSSARAGVYWRNAAGPDQTTTTRIWVSPTP